jgi:hypothetical protein
MNSRLRFYQQAEWTPVVLTGGAALQRKCDCGNHTMGGGCDDCAKKKSSLQRKKTNDIASSEAPPIVREVLRSPGQPLDATSRGFFEARFECLCQISYQP